MILSLACVLLLTWRKGETMKQLPVDLTLVPQTQGDRARPAAATGAAGIAGEPTAERGSTPRTTAGVSSRSSFSHRLRKAMEKMDRREPAPERAPERAKEQAKDAQNSPDAFSGPLPRPVVPAAAVKAEAATGSLGAIPARPEGPAAAEGQARCVPGGGKDAEAVPERGHSPIERGGLKASGAGSVTSSVSEKERSAALRSLPPDGQAPWPAAVLSSRTNGNPLEKTGAPVPLPCTADGQGKASGPDGAPGAETPAEFRTRLSASLETGTKADADGVLAAETVRIRGAAPAGAGRKEIPAGGPAVESGGESIPRGLPRGKRANDVQDPFLGDRRSSGACSGELQRAGSLAKSPDVVPEMKNVNGAPKTGTAGIVFAEAPQDPGAPAAACAAPTRGADVEPSRAAYDGPARTSKPPQGRENPSRGADRTAERVAAGGNPPQEVAALVRRLGGEGDRRPSDAAAAGGVSDGKNRGAAAESPVPGTARNAAQTGDLWTAFVEVIDESVRKAEGAGPETGRRATDTFGKPAGHAENGTVAAGDGRTVGVPNAFVPPSAAEPPPRAEISTAMARIAEEGRRLIVDEGGGRVVMSLDPPELGSLDMDVKVRNSSVQIVLAAEDRTVQQLLQSQRDVLERALAEGGLRVESFDVVLSSSADGGNSSSHRWQARQESPAGGAAQAGVGEPDREGIPSARLIADEAVGNGISLFV